MATPRIGLPEILPSQAQKHITHNDALVILDALVQGSVISRTETSPPGSPETGDAYIVAATATGDWLGRENDLAVYEASAWSFYTPLTGFLLYCAADGEHITFAGSSWLSFTDALPFLASSGGTITGDLVMEDGSPSFEMNTTAVSGAQSFFRMSGARTSTTATIAQIDFDNNGTGVEGTAAQWLITGTGDVNLSVGKLQVNGQDVFHAGNLATGSDSRRFGLVGIGGATPDATNPFAFYGENMLFDSGGSINAKFNKNAPGNDASMTFQSAFSTKALMGLLGDDNFTLKVGSSFLTALVASETTGQVSFPNGQAGPWLCQIRNTDTTTDLNAAAFSVVPMNGVEDMRDAVAFERSGDGIKCLRPGRVKVTGSVLGNGGTNQRAAFDLSIAVNGSRLSGIGQSSYMRGLDGHATGSSHISKWVVVAANDIITLQSRRAGSAATVVMVDGESVLTVEQFQ